MKRILYVLLTFAIVMLVIGCNNKESENSEYSGTLLNKNYYYISYPKSIDRYENKLEFIKEKIKIDEKSRINTEGTIADFSKNGQTTYISVEGYNLINKNKSVIFSYDREYFVFYNSKLDNIDKEKIFRLFAYHGESMTYEEGKAYFKE